LFGRANSIGCVAGSFGMLLFSRIVSASAKRLARGRNKLAWRSVSPGQTFSRPRTIHARCSSRRALSFFFSGSLAQAYGWRTAMALAAASCADTYSGVVAAAGPCAWGQRNASSYAGARFNVEHSAHPNPLVDYRVRGAPELQHVRHCHLFFRHFLAAFTVFSLASSGIASGFVYLSGGLAGCVTAGYLGDSIVRRRRDGRLRIAAMTALAAAPLACYGVLQPRGSLLIATIFLTLAYALLTTYYGLVYSAIQDLVAPNQRGATMAIYFMAMYMCGASFGPLLTGRSAISWHTAPPPLPAPPRLTKASEPSDFSRLC